MLASRAGESHPRALLEPYVNLSIHTAPDVRPVESYPAGKEIYAKGSLGRRMMAVLCGRAKMASVSRDGKEIVLILCTQVKSSVKSPC